MSARRDMLLNFRDKAIAENTAYALAVIAKIAAHFFCWHAKCCSL